MRGESYKDLLYVRRKFIHKENLRQAISKVTNSILDARVTEVWGKEQPHVRLIAKIWGLGSELID